MVNIENTLCATYSELVDSGIMSVDALNWSRRKGELKQIVRGGNCREAMFSVDSLPLKYKHEFYRRNPDLRATTEALTFVETVEIDGAAHAFFSAYTYGRDNRHLPASVVNEYTNNASIFNRLTQMLDKANSLRQRLGDKRLGMTKFWQDKAIGLPLIADKLAHTLPTHFRKLQAKYNAYMRDGYEVLISKHYANVRAAKVQNEQQIAAILTIISHNNNLNNEQVVSVYNSIADHLIDQDWQPITARTVGNIRSKNEYTTNLARRGKSEFYNKFAMQVKRSAPTAPLLFWTIDGWDVELYYHKATENDKGHNVTGYSHRVTLVVVLDAFNKYPIGYAIGAHESPELIQQAMKDAVNHTRELFGERYRACQVQSDHYAFKNLTPLYAVIGDKVTPARVHNAKAKIIEPYFKYLNTTYCQWMHNWSGFGITSRKESQPSVEGQNAIRKQYPDLEGVIAQISGIMARERSAKLATYMTGYEHTPTECRLPLSAENYLLTFGDDTGRLNAIEGVGLRPTIGGIKRDFDCFDLDFRKFCHVRWEVKYDPSDLSKALAVSEDGTLRFMLENKYIQPMALADRKAGDAEQLERINTYNKTLMFDVKQKHNKVIETTEHLLLENPSLRNELSKTLIVNSLGQHKDARNAIRHQLENGNTSDGDIYAPVVSQLKPKRRKKQPIRIPSRDEIETVTPVMMADSIDDDTLSQY